MTITKINLEEVFECNNDLIDYCFMQHPNGQFTTSKGQVILQGTFSCPRASTNLLTFTVIIVTPQAVAYLPFFHSSHLLILPRPPSLRNHKCPFYIHTVHRLSSPRPTVADLVRWSTSPNKTLWGLPYITSAKCSEFLPPPLSLSQII